MDTMLKIEEDVLGGGAWKILVVDDESTIREVLVDFLVLEGFEVTCANDGEQGLEFLAREHFDAVLLDMKMPGISGLDVLRQLPELAPDTLAIMMTGYGTVETAIEAMKLGAFDYVLKPFKVQDVIRLLERGLEQKRLEHENIQLREAVSLYELSEEMAATLELADIYQILIDAARQEVGADAVAIWVRKPQISGGKGLTVDNPFVSARRWSRTDLDASQFAAVRNVDVSHLAGRVERDESLLLSDDEARAICPDLEPGRALSVLGIPLRVKGTLLGFFVAHSFGEKHGFREGKRKMLSILCGRASAAIENGRLYRELQDTFKQTIQVLANLLEDKDPYTRGHSDRVSQYARLIAEELGMSEADVEEIADCALMHDIGKLGIRYEDLNKVEPLTEAEYEMFKSHTTRGKWILEPIEFLHHLIPGVYHHHERWDGRGYPLGLRGEEIPLVARILAIADTYDAMTSHRAYRRALPHDVAIREIQAFAGAQFDPELVDVFIQAMERKRSGYYSKAQRWNALKEYVPPRLAASGGGSAGPMASADMMSPIDSTE
jgi:putative nucleotidyltransferase with HDIG domain